MSAFCVVSSEVGCEVTERLRETFSEVFALLPDQSIAAPVATHPDMLLSELDGLLFLPRSYYMANTELIESIADMGGLTVCPTEVDRRARYPYDVSFNVAVWRDSVICRTASTCPELLSAARECGYRIVSVKQGYAGCSCLVTNEAVLTFDRGIAETLTRHDIPCVLAKDGGVALPGYDRGFLGGACGFFDGDIYIFGNADTLPCADTLRRYGRVISLSNSAVTDRGGIKIFIKR